MSSPKHQHFIPQSYLKNFSEKLEDKFFVEGKLRGEDAPKPKPISIKDICVDKNLYTMPLVEGEDKYKLEKFYAKNVDAVYPEVYGILTDPNTTTLTKKQREKIIMTTMSLFFRTPKFLNSKQRTLNLVFDHAISNHLDDNGNVKFKHGNIVLDFHISKAEETRQDLKIKNKLQFLSEHIKNWHEFIQYKINCGLQVFKIIDDIDLITCDNPVDMHSVAGNPFNIFDPTNMISLPLDPKHYLVIYPNTESNIEDLIFRAERDKRFALTRNHSTEQNSEDWILGKPLSITAHMKDQVAFGALTEDNLKMVEGMKEQAEDAMALYEIIESVGLLNKQVANKLKELLLKPMHKNDKVFKEMELELKRHGLW